MTDNLCRRLWVEHDTVAKAAQNYVEHVHQCGRPRDHALVGDKCVCRCGAEKGPLV